MADHILGFSALSCLTLAILIFLSRMFNVVTPRSRAYGPVNWAFFWVFGMAIVLGDAFLTHQFYPLTQTLTVGMRWAISAGEFVVILIPGAYVFLTMCVGMNFMGQ